MFLFERVPVISGKEMVKKLAEKPTVLDIRQKDAFVSGHIPNAMHLPIDKLSGYKGKKDQPVYVVCYSGSSSKQAVKHLISQGYDAYSVQGGMGMWQGPVKGGR